VNAIRRFNAAMRRQHQPLNRQVRSAHASASKSRSRLRSSI
jgi:hypothetical protein